MSPSRQEALLDILIRATKPLAGKTLASRLMVSSRTVRTLIHDLRRDGLPIVSSPLGYSLDLNRGLGQVPQEPHTPEKRLASICTTLVASDSPINVHDLAEELFVSDSTIETDLSRARQMLKQYDLRIERDKDTIRLVGSEGSRRRLVRQFLYGSAKELGPSTWSAMVSEFRHIDIAALRSALEEVFRDHGVELTEYALASIVLHTAVAIDRTQRGHPLGEDQTPSELPGLDITVKSSHAEIQRDAVTVGSSHITPDDDLLDSIVVGCARAVQEVCWVEFAPAEMRSLRDLLVVRGISGVLVADSTSPVAPEVARMTEELLNQLAQDFSIGATSPKGPLNMALHVQGLLVRSAAGAPLPPPLGDGFKRSHPLLHDFALRFAASLEERCGIRIDPVELDYLALHLGMQLMPSLEERDLVTITVVVPRYYDVGSQLVEQIRSAIKGVGAIEQVAQGIDFDFGSVSSDIIISTVPPAGPASARVVLVHPLPSRGDLDHVARSVRAERDKAVRRRIRTALSTLLDPDLFIRHEAPLTQEEALRTLTDRLLQAGYTEEHFYDDVLDRERASSTAFGGDFAIPHSMRMDANGTAIAALVCDDGVQWGADRVHLVLLFALSPDGRSTFRDVLDEITHLLAEGTLVNELIAGGTSAEQFISTFMELLDRDAS